DPLPNVFPVLEPLVPRALHHERFADHDLLQKIPLHLVRVAPERAELEGRERRDPPVELVDGDRPRAYPRDDGRLLRRRVGLHAPSLPCAEAEPDPEGEERSLAHQATPAARAAAAFRFLARCEYPHPTSSEAASGEKAMKLVTPG